MKYTPFIAAMLFFCTVHAQEYNKVKIGFTLGYLNRDQPFTASLEGGYRINDKMLIGYRTEFAAASDHNIKSKSLFYQIYFSGFTKKFRPFVSLGVGQYTPSTDMAGGCGMPQANRNVNIEKKIGAFSRIGFDLGHFSLMVDANFVAKSKSILESNLSPTDGAYHTPYVQYLSNSYVTLKLGFYFGGGKKKVKAEKINP
ncbi:MAG: hypothetical protein JST48_10210 [Bacteroidetes bacterium]|nr:hypothetical protein [Bacteroidota bacterium]